MNAQPTTPPPAALDCDGFPCCLRAGCGLCAQWARDTATVPAVGPDPVAAYLRKRAAIAALWAECDVLWDGMSESQHDHVVSALTTPPRRGRG